MWQSTGQASWVRKWEVICLHTCACAWLLTFHLEQKADATLTGELLAHSWGGGHSGRAVPSPLVAQPVLLAAFPNTSLGGPRAPHLPGGATRSTLGKNILPGRRFQKVKPRGLISTAVPKAG